MSLATKVDILSVKSAIKQQKLYSKTSKFIKLRKGDVSCRLKKAKSNPGQNRRVLISRVALTRRAILYTLKPVVHIDACCVDRE